MLIVYDSKTGKVERFIQRLNMRAIKVHPNLVIHEPFVLVTYTIGFGEVPNSVVEFLNLNHTFIKGVAASGNKVWGKNYGKAADIIAAKYNIPILHKFELYGSDKDTDYFKQRVEKLNEIH